MVRVQLVSYSFPPAMSGAAYSTFKLAYPLAQDRDFELHVCTADTSMYSKIDNSFERLLASLKITRVRWRGQRLFEILNHRVRFEPDDYALFAWKTQRLLRQLEPADVYILRGQAFSTFHLARFIRRHIGRPVILYFSDPLLQNEYYRWTPILRRRIAALESSALAASNGAIFTNDQALRKTLRRYGKLKIDTLVVPHVYMGELYPETGGSYHGNGKVTLTYAGTFYGKRQPYVLLKALAELKREQNPIAEKLQIAFVGVDKKQYESQLAALGIAGEVSFLPRLPYLECLRVLVASDVLVNIDAPSSVSAFLPGKLVDYLGCKKPIWSLSPPGPGASLVETYGGVVTPPDDVEATKAALSSCVEKTLNNAWQLDLALAQEFDHRNVYPRFKQFILRVSRRN